MNVAKRIKATPKRILVFGAGDHIGAPLAQYVERHAPQTTLRLATSSSERVGGLQRMFPSAEVVVANYLDQRSLETAFRDVEGVFVVTPDFFNEKEGMKSVVAAAKAVGTITHIVRILSDTPGMTLERLPQALKALGPGPAVQHFEARDILQESGLPVTFLNSAGYFMDDFLFHFSPPLKRSRKLVVPFDRLMCFTDTRDLGEAAARLLLSEEADHIGAYYHFNSGEPPLLFSQVAALMSEVLGTTIGYDGTPETFLQELGPILHEITGDDRAAHYFVVNWQMERDNQEAFKASDFGARILGRQPVTLREWLQEHRERLL